MAALSRLKGKERNWKSKVKTQKYEALSLQLVQLDSGPDFGVHFLFLTRTHLSQVASAIAAMSPCRSSSCPATSSRPGPNQEEGGPSATDLAAEPARPFPGRI